MELESVYIISALFQILDISEVCIIKCIYCQILMMRQLQETVWKTIEQFIRRKLKSITGAHLIQIP